MHWRKKLHFQSYLVHNFPNFKFAWDVGEPLLKICIAFCGNVFHVEFWFLAQWTFALSNVYVSFILISKEKKCFPVNVVAVYDPGIGGGEGDMYSDQ